MASPEVGLILGCGYLGRRVAARWVASGRHVVALTRSTEKAEEFARASITPVLGDVTDAATLGRLPRADVVLFAVGYDRKASVRRPIGEVYVEGLRSTLKALQSAPPRRLVYISSTGVYGDAGGDWIDEDSPCAPAREGGIACLAAESLLKDSLWSERSIVLRLAGIYGPGRLPNGESLMKREPIAATDSGYLNLIHVEDAASAVDLAIERATPPRTYNVSDGSPVLRGDYYREAARQLGAPPPTFDSTSSSARVTRAGADKRIDNGRIVRELGFSARYSDYRAGIAASLP